MPLKDSPFSLAKSPRTLPGIMNSRFANRLGEQTPDDPSTSN